MYIKIRLYYIHYVCSKNMLFSTICSYTFDANMSNVLLYTQLYIDFVAVAVCVCPPPRLLITSGMMWCDMDLIRLVKQVLQLLYGNCSRYR